jgi:hypothetical protein
MGGAPAECLLRGPGSELLTRSVPQSTTINPRLTCSPAPDGGPIGMLLAARVCGDWSRALHEFSRTPVDADVDTVDADADLEAGEGNEIVHEKREAPAPVRTEDDEDELPGREAHLMLEGPYGGPTLRVGDFERVLLFAGGSGVTFTLGVLDELVGRCVRLGRRDGEKTRRVVWCWCVRSFGGCSSFLSLVPPTLIPPRRDQLVRPAPPPNRHPRRAPGGAARPPHPHLRHLPLRPDRRAAHPGLHRHRGAALRRPGARPPARPRRSVRCGLLR